MSLIIERFPVWSSSFKIIEAPMRYFESLDTEHGFFLELFNFPTSFERHTNEFHRGLVAKNWTRMKESLEGFKRDIQSVFSHLYEKKILVLTKLGMTIAHPISWGLTPVTIITDIFAGIIQVAICSYYGADKEEIKSILHKKIIAAPAQQFIYFTINLLAISPFVITTNRLLNQSSASNALFGSFFFGDVIYRKTQGLISFGLPRFLAPDGFNIFFS